MQAADAKILQDTQMHWIPSLRANCHLFSFTLSRAPVDFQKAASRLKLRLSQQHSGFLKLLAIDNVIFLILFEDFKHVT